MTTERETYRSVDDADAYFNTQLFATDWTGASSSDKTSSLLMASRAIDSLKYKGVKRALWQAMIDDGGDATKSTDYLVGHTELTDLEIEAAEVSQLKQFPRDDEKNAESWTLTIDATGGTFDLTLNDESALAIAFDASAATVQSDLEGLASMSSGDVTVTGSNGGPYTITMAGTKVAQFNNNLVADGSSLTGGAGTAIVLTVEDNIPDAIFYAVCEEAKSLLSGRDAEQEFRNLELNSDGIGSNRITMDRSQTYPEHTHHLITSPLAWKYIQRFLDQNNTFRFQRR